MKDAQRFWDKTAPRYAKSRIKDQESYQQKLAITRAYFRPDWTVLEFGCGTGTTAISHAPYVKHILATDISPKMLEIAQDKARAAGVENLRFQQGSLESLELEAESFNAVLGLNILHLIEDVPSELSRVHALLKPGGIFISSTALLAELKPYWRMLIPVMQALGLAPHVTGLGKQELLSMLNHVGFRVDYQWQPKPGAIFIVAKKGDEALKRWAVA